MGNYFLKGIFKRAAESGLFKLRIIDLRDFSNDKYKRVDDFPIGHRQGMLLRSDVIERAISSIEHYQDYQLLYTCPKGPVLTQKTVTSFWEASTRGLIVLCGYYEGVDERIFSVYPFKRFSIGEIVLSSGELPALILTEAIVRQIPGVLGNVACLEADSFTSGLLEYPQYTLPANFHGHLVPEILYSGHHQKIAQWQNKQALQLTLSAKPHLLWTYPLNKETRKQLTEILQEEN